MKPKCLSRSLALCTLLGLSTSLGLADPLGTAFTYHGRLNDGVYPANGVYDFRLAIYDATNGTGQVGTTLTNPAVLVSEGLFILNLDFGTSIFTGDARWLEIGVRSNGVAVNFTTLSPRQLLTPTPYALYATNAGAATTATTATTAGSAATFTGPLAGDVTGNQNSTVVGSVGGQSAANVATGVSAANAATAANTPNTIVKRDGSGNFSAGAISATSVSGAGSGLTGLNASQLASGTVADERLSANVGRLNANQVFSGSNRFAGVVQLTNLDNTIAGHFSGSGSGLTSLNPANLAPGVATIDITGNAATATSATTATTATSASTAGSFTGPLAGDVTGTQGATLLSKIQGVQVSTTTPSPNQLLRYNGSQWTPDSVALATDVSGTLADARLSSNVGLLNTNQVFSGSNRFAGVVQMTNVNNTIIGTFNGNGASLIALNAANLSSGTVSDALLSPNVALRTGGNNFTGDQNVAGNIGYSGQLSKLNVAENWEAVVRAADFKLGHSTRHGAPGRALVDFGNSLVVNFDADWTNTVVDGNVTLDPRNLNDGALSLGLTFGGGSGEGIASKRTSGGNQYGLDFYQNWLPRLSIVQGGNVGIGTTTPQAKLEVNGVVQVDSDLKAVRLNIGTGHTLSGTSATIAGGEGNTAGGLLSAVGGGWMNQALAREAAVVGGEQNVASGERSYVGGGFINTATAEEATVSGGRDNHATAWRATVGGGVGNIATNVVATISGGGNNTAGGLSAAVGGGSLNLALGETAAIGGGEKNRATGKSATVAGGFMNTASGNDATVSGGDQNTASAFGAMVPGGWLCLASGNTSFAAGTQAKATRNGAFVWADSLMLDYDPQSYPDPGGIQDSFNVRAQGGVYFATAVNGTSGRPTAGMYLGAGGSGWNAYCDRNAKTNFQDMDGRDVLDRLMSIPIQAWNYKAQDESVRHLGPMAQDFNAAFGTGEADKVGEKKYINSVDADGVALAAIQGLNLKLEEQRAENVALKKRLAELEQAVRKLTTRGE